MINVEKFSSKELYNILIFLNPKIPTSRNYFDNKFKDESLNWEAIYLLSWRVTIDSHTRIFQYKILHNILYLNNNLCKFGIAPSPLCSFCLASEETPNHLFSRCIITTSLWSELKLFSGGTIDLPDLIPQTAILGYLNIDHDSIMINLVKYVILTKDFTIVFLDLNLKLRKFLYNFEFQIFSLFILNFL